MRASKNFDNLELEKRECFYSTDRESALAGCRSGKTQRIERKLHPHECARYRIKLQNRLSVA